MTHPDPILAAYVSGVLTAGFLVAGLFFLRFWRSTRDSLLLSFAVAFGLLAANAAVPTLFGVPSENQGYVYLLRLAAFGLIIWAVLRKNLRGG